MIFRFYSKRFFQLIYVEYTMPSSGNNAFTEIVAKYLSSPAMLLLLI